jgi:tripartite-type tricarboxylate transporter receptor subunit TctC
VPDLPTIAEAGLPGYQANSWAGVMAPAGTPKEIVQKLNADLVKALSQPDVRNRLLQSGAEPMPSTPEEFGKFLKAEITKWGKLVKDANIKVD